MLTRGKPSWSVKMLAALVVMILLPTWVDGIVLKKCELKSQLEAEGDKAVDIIAKLVCTAEQTSGFDTNLVSTTGYFNSMNKRYKRSSKVLKIRKWRSGPFNNEGTGMSGETSGDGLNDQSDETREADSLPNPTDEMVSKMVPMKPLERPLKTTRPIERKRKRRSMHSSRVQQVRKRRCASSNEQESWMTTDSSGDGSIDQLEGTQIPPTSPYPKIYYDTYEMLFGSRRFPPDGAIEPTDFPYDTYERLFGNGRFPPDRTTEPTDIPYDTYEMLFGNGRFPPDRAIEPTDFTYDTYEMLFGNGRFPPDRAIEPTNFPYDTYEMLFGNGRFPPDRAIEPTDFTYDTYEMLFGNGRFPPDRKIEPTDIQYDTYEMLFDPREAPDRTRYGIFQLSDSACNSGLDYSLNHCELDCSALTDDDITDDIACLMSLDENVKQMTFTPECLSVDSSEYFAECG
ncbi:uncharacterized protein wu:fj19g03 [Silurus meridionalis]|nr:uncharacterized protein wu:fj19g03 [Silurus meridionalis]